MVRSIRVTLFTFLLCLVFMGQAMAAGLPKVAILATGGT